LKNGAAAIHLIFAEFLSGQWGVPPGSQFTSNAFTGILKEREIAISMDGRGRALDNIFVERLWRSVKYESKLV
jgi:transposase InsO family protein